MRKKYIFVVFIFIYVTALCIYLYNTAIMNTDFVVWCKTISASDLDVVHWNFYADTITQSDELSTSEKQQISEILNNLQRRDIKVIKAGTGAPSVPDQTLYLSSNETRYILQYSLAKPKFIYVLTDYDEAIKDPWGIRGHIWITNKELISLFLSKLS